MDVFKIRIPYMSKRDNYQHIAELKIYSSDREHVQLFIKQHRITIYEITLFPEYEYYPSLDVIKPFKFYSNNDHRIYTIYTTERFVKYSKAHVGGRLSDYMTFGNLILRDDIPIIEIIFKLLETLPHVVIQEYVKLDDDDCTESQRKHKHVLYEDLELMLHEFDTVEDCYFEYIYNSLGYYDEHPDANVQSISLEGYVEYISTLSIK